MSQSANLQTSQSELTQYPLNGTDRDKMAANPVFPRSILLLLRNSFYGKSCLRISLRSPTSRIRRFTAIYFNPESKYNGCSYQSPIVEVIASWHRGRKSCGARRKELDRKKSLAWKTFIFPFTKNLIWITDTPYVRRKFVPYTRLYQNDATTY